MLNFPFSLFRCSSVLLLIICTYSCTPHKYVYSPTTMNMLQAEKAGSAKVAVNYSTAGNLLFFDFEKKKVKGD